MYKYILKSNGGFNLKLFKVYNDDSMNELNLEDYTLSCSEYKDSFISGVRKIEFKIKFIEKNLKESFFIDTENLSYSIYKNLIEYML